MSFVLVLHLLVASTPTPAADATPANASPEMKGAPPESAPAARAAEREWYGLELLGVDIGAAALIVAGNASGAYGATFAGSALMISGAAVYSLGGPLLHLVYRDRPETALLDLGIRLAIPLAAGTIGFGLGYAIGGGGFLGATGTGLLYAILLAPWVESPRRSSTSPSSAGPPAPPRQPSRRAPLHSGGRRWRARYAAPRWPAWQGRSDRGAGGARREDHRLVLAARAFPAAGGYEGATLLR